jgi:AbrB family looped-hinge helix DNA binding protein
MTEVPVGPKGQIVIPKALRDKYRIAAGDRVHVEDHDDHIAVDVRPMRERLDAFWASVPRRAGGSDLDAAALKRLAEEQYEDEWR